LGFQFQLGQMSPVTAQRIGQDVASRRPYFAFAGGESVFVQVRDGHPIPFEALSGVHGDNLNRRIVNLEVQVSETGFLLFPGTQPVEESAQRCPRNPPKITNQV